MEKKKTKKYIRKTFDFLPEVAEMIEEDKNKSLMKSETEYISYLVKANNRKLKK